MAIKANASSTGAGFKKYIGVGSFRVLGVNPNKEELERFYGNTKDEEPVYLKEKQDANDNNKTYKQLRVSFMIQADDPAHVDKNNMATKKTNEALTEPFKTTVNFFIDSRYFYNKDKSKVQVIDKYGRTAWVTIEQAKNHQIPVYSNGPAKLDKDYRPAYRGEEELTRFILNYLNVTPIETYNRNTGQWVTNPHPEDCEGRLESIQKYFNGDISELKDYCKYLPTNCIKLLVGVRTDDNGREFGTVYTRITLRNGSNSFTVLNDSLNVNKDYLQDTVFTDDPTGNLTNIHEYKENVQETDLSKAPAADDDPFKQAAALPEDDLPFGGSDDKDPFADVA